MSNKQAALDFFADLLPSTPKKDTLFDTPAAKPKRQARRWSVSCVTVVKQAYVCSCCGSYVQVVNPHMMLTKVLNDYDGKILKSIDTDCPEEADLGMITADTPVQVRIVNAGYAEVCTECIDKRTPGALKEMFKAQVSRLKEDPERRKAIADKAAKAEQELMDLLSAYEQSPTVRADDSIVDRVIRDSDLPY